VVRSGRRRQSPGNHPIPAPGGTSPKSGWSLPYSVGAGFGGTQRADRRTLAPRPGRTGPAASADRTAGRSAGHRAAAVSRGLSGPLQPPAAEGHGGRIVAGVIELAGAYKPPNHMVFRFPEHALAQQNTEDTTTARPAEYSRDALGFRDLRPAYVSALLNGLREAIAAQRTRNRLPDDDAMPPHGLAWEPVLALAASIASKHDPCGRNAEQHEDSPRGPARSSHPATAGRVGVPGSCPGRDLAGGLRVLAPDVVSRADPATLPTGEPAVVRGARCSSPPGRGSPSWQWSMAQQRPAAPTRAPSLT
jgi:hypothetical protein